MIDEKESEEILFNILKQSGLPFREVRDGEEGGIFYKDAFGNLKKFTENIFVKRSVAQQGKDDFLAETKQT